MIKQIFVVFLGTLLAIVAAFVLSQLWLYRTLGI